MKLKHNLLFSQNVYLVIFNYLIFSSQAIIAERCGLKIGIKPNNIMNQHNSPNYNSIVVTIVTRKVSGKSKKPLYKLVAATAC